MNGYVNSYQQYKKHDVMMANPIELIVMLYNGGIKRLKLARIAIEDKRYEDVNTHIQKAEEIVMELVNGLDFSYGISTELMSLYDFMLHQLIQINASKDVSAIDPLVGMLTGLRDTWVQVQKQTRGSFGQIAESE